MNSSYCYHLGSLVIVILFSAILLLENNFNYFGMTDNIYHDNDYFNFNILQKSYSQEEEEEDDDNDDDDNRKDTNGSDKKDKSIFNIAAVGDWDCTGETEDTVDNIVEQDPELVLALGDFSYSGDADCWFELIEPIADKTKIAMGNHEDEEDYLDFFV